MRQKQNNPRKVTKKLKQYAKEAMIRAYRAVTEGKVPVERAARCFGVPAQTLRDRILNKVKMEAAMGRETIFTEEEEQLLVKHLTELSDIGYGLNRSQFNLLASEMAVKLGKIPSGKHLSTKWYYGFLRRWDSRLKVVKPRSLTSNRAAALTQDCIDSYFIELNNIMVKYDLLSKPHLIYNIDETGLQPEHRPSYVITNKTSRNTQAVTSPNSTTVTLIGCVNAAGTALPPYYVFKGKRQNDDLLDESMPDSAYAMTETGWSNSTVFMKYLEEHFLKYAQVGVDSGDNNDKVLLLLDGHVSHVSIELIRWARDRNIILLVLPPHSSHAVQPLDVGCFGPFKSCYYTECNLFMAKQRGTVITKYEVAQHSGRAYQKTMTPVNITAAFRKCGIVPLDKTRIPPEIVKPSASFNKKPSSTPPESLKELLDKKMIETAPSASFMRKTDKKKKKSEEVNTKKPRLGGKAITEYDIVVQIEKK